MEKTKHVVLRNEYRDKLIHIKEITGMSQEEIVQRSLLYFEKNILPLYEQIHNDQLKAA